MTTYVNEDIFGPLQVKGEIKGNFNYNTSEKLQISENLFDYLKNNTNVHDIYSSVNEMVESNFTRIIEIDIGNIEANPIIGILTVNCSNNLYDITHLSIHKSFRNQGLAKMLLMSLANYCCIRSKCENDSVIITIPEHMDDLSRLVKRYNFTETYHLNFYYVSTSTFKQITKSQI